MTHMITERLRYRAAGAAACLAVLALGACSTDSASRTTNTGLVEAPGTTPGTNAATPRTLSTGVRAAVGVFGSVTFDQMILPIVSPDGRHLASEAGLGPTWATLLATPESADSVRTSIDLYRIDLLQPRQEDKMAFHTRVAEPALLVCRLLDLGMAHAEQVRAEAARSAHGSGQAGTRGNLARRFSQPPATPRAPRQPSGHVRWSWRGAPYGPKAKRNATWALDVVA